MENNSNLSQGQLCFSADSLLRGGFYAMEQAWHLFEDAVLLFQHRRYGSSLVLAVYCLEELGRTEIYLEGRELALKSEVVTVESVKKQCNKHPVKLSQGQIRVTAAEGSWGEVLERSAEAELVDRLQNLKPILEEQAPRNAHRKRLQALYVDPSDDGERWNRPSLTVTPEEADEWLGAAYWGYVILRGKLLRDDDSELATAVRNWVTRPELSEPRWDPWGWSESV